MRVEFYNLEHWSIITENDFEEQVLHKLTENPLLIIPTINSITIISKKEQKRREKEIDDEGEKA